MNATFTRYTYHFDLGTLKRFLCALFCALLFLNSSCIGISESQEATELKAGFFAFDGYHNLDANGARSGYGYDLLQMISRYANVRFSYPGYENTLNECLNLLEKGKIDLVTAVKKTAEREERFDFSARNVGVVSTILTVKAGNTAIESGDYSTYDGIRIGVQNDGMREFEMDTFASENGFTYQPVHFKSTQEMSDALQSGEIDALVSSSLCTRNNEWTIDSFNESPIYVAVQKGDAKTLSVIDEALDRMEIEEYHWRTDLELKYYTSMQSNLPYFTKEEREYLAGQLEEGRVFTVLVSPERYPYSYLEDGKIVGIMPDLFDLIAQRAGIKYEWVISEGREDYAVRLFNGDADICIDMTPDHDSAEKAGYRITDQYLSAPFSWIRRNDTNGDISLAARLFYTSNTPAQFAYEKNYHDIEYISYLTSEECLQSVLDGATDAYCTYTFNAEYILLNDLTGELVTTVAQNENHFAIGVTMKHDFRLTTILNTVIDCIEDWERTEIIRRHTQFSATEYSIKELLIHNNRVQMLAALIVIITIFLLLTIAQQINRQKSLRKTIRSQNRRLDESLQSMLDVLAAAIEFRSHEAGTHVQRTRSTVLTLLQALKKLYPREYNFSENTMIRISNAAVLHDVGKIAIPDHILNKPGKLNKDEFEIIKQHTIKGCMLLDSIPEMQHEPLCKYAWDICRWHHERWDGSGYPDGLSGNQIPIWSQVAAVADVFEALTSNRVYKKAYSAQEAIDMILNGECGAFNPAVLNAFSSVSGKLKSSVSDQDLKLSSSPASRSATSLLLTAFQIFFDTTDSLVFIKDTELIYRAVSPQFARAVNIPSELILHHSDADLLTDKDKLKRFTEEDQKLLETGETFVGPIEKISEINGLSSYGYTTKQLITDSLGRTMGILGITRDITAQYHALRHHEISLSYLNRLADDMYFFICIDVNDWLIVGEKRQTINGIGFDPYKTTDDFSQKAFHRVYDHASLAYNFYKDFDSSHLFSIAEKIRSRITMEYLREMPNGDKKWVRDEVNFLTHPLSGHLCVTIAVYDIQKKKEEEMELIMRSQRDELTGLLNRASIRTLIDQCLLRHDEDKHAMFLIDIDNYKLVNDTLGHPAGDRFLSNIARILNDCFRSSDFIGRIGGDEFAVLMKNVSGRKEVETKATELVESFGTLLDAALDAAASSDSPVAWETILKRVKQSAQPLSRSKSQSIAPRISASVGIGLFPNDGTTREELYAHADEAMYKAKVSGKNKFIFYEDIRKK